MQKRHFTLIEMLTVLAIIMVLAGMLLGTFGYVKNKARRTDTQMKLTSLVSAVNAYRTEYHVYPFTLDFAAAQDVVLYDGGYRVTSGTTGGSPSIADLLTCLEGTNSVSNPRQIAFLKTGSGFRDAWAQGGNTGFAVAMDLDVNNVIAADVIAGEANDLSSGAVAWSVGPDRAHNFTDTHADNDDNVKSWSDQ